MLKSDRWIRKTAREHDMINPFSEKQVREGVISYGLSSYGYDLRVADEFKIFTNVNSTIVDPKISTRNPSSQCALISVSSRRTHSPWLALSNTLKFLATF
jgi:deoxycytidine triphosphate deaminase